MTGALVFVTDYGLEDGYAAQLRAAAWAVDPGLRCVDGTHLVEPGDILSAAYRCKTLAAAFGAGAVLCVVVDPGVGTDRAAVALECDGVRAVAPDTGLLSYLWEEAGDRRAVRLRTPPSVSATFHGRDLFAPTAARLASGPSLSGFGDPLAAPRVATEIIPTVEAGGLRTRVVCVDHFGNAITGVRRTDIGGSAVASVEWQAGSATEVVATYADIEGIAALWNSSGHLEIAARSESAAARAGLSVGSAVLVRQR